MPNAFLRGAPAPGAIAAPAARIAPAGHPAPGPGAGSGVTPPPGTAAPAGPMPNTGGIKWLPPGSGNLPEFQMYDSLATQLGEAAANAPVYNAQQQALEATAQQQAATAKQATADAILQRLVPALRANPALVDSPQFMAHIQPILTERGLTAPVDPTTGKIDAQKLAAMLSPTPQLTPAETDQMYNSITTKEKALGTANYTPGMFLADIKSARQRLLQAGQSTAPLDEYLNADGTGLSDSFIDNYVGEKAGEDIQHLKDLGVHMGNEDELRKILEQDHKDEFGKTLQFKYAQLSVQEQKVKLEASVQAQKLQLAQGNLAARWAGVQNAQQRFAQTQNAYDLRVFQTVVSDTQRQMDAAHSELLRTQQTMNNIVANPGALKRPEIAAQFRQLSEQATSLQNFLNTNEPTLHAMQQNAAQGVGTLYTNITGTPATVHTYAKGTTVTGHPGYTFTGVESDGPKGKVYQVRGPDGKLSTYQP